MARPRKTVQANGWIVEVVSNPNFCGTDAGGVQFLRGKSEVITNKWLAQWFAEHEGYKVTPVGGETTETTENAE